MQCNSRCNSQTVIKIFFWFIFYFLHFVSHHPVLNYCSHTSVSETLEILHLFQHPPKLVLGQHRHYLVVSILAYYHLIYSFYMYLKQAHIFLDQICLDTEVWQPAGLEPALQWQKPSHFTDCTTQATRRLIHYILHLFQAKFVREKKAMQSMQDKDNQIVICYDVLCCALLCFVVLYHDLPTFAKPCCALILIPVLCLAVLCKALLLYTMLCILMFFRL